MTGEYTGADGRTYQIKGIEVKTDPYPMNPYQGFTGRGTLYPGHPDWPAAKAALDALIEVEQEWVELPQVASEWSPRRVSGDRGQRLVNGEWVDLDETDPVLVGYRKGREAALEQVRELVKLINVLSLKMLVMPDGDGWLNYYMAEDVEAVRKAAKAVEL